MAKPKKRGRVTVRRVNSAEPHPSLRGIGSTVKPAETPNYDALPVHLSAGGRYAILRGPVRFALAPIASEAFDVELTLVGRVNREELMGLAEGLVGAVAQ